MNFIYLSLQFDEVWKKKKKTPPSSDSEPQAISILWGHLVGISDLVAL